MELNNYKVLLVDDETDILEFLGYNLKKEGFEIYTATNGYNAIELAKVHEPDLILLDVMMPEMDGIETCHELRKIPELKDVLIAFLTARGEDYSQIAGFEAGADDYINKPIKPKVLISRLYALLKRMNRVKNPEQDSVLIKKGNMLIDKEKYIVTYNNEIIFLPKKEFELLVLLSSKHEKVFTRDEIYRRIWGDSIIVGDRTIDVHIRKLRKKFGDQHIKTIKGVGYKFVE